MLHAVLEALALLGSLDREVVAIAALSLQVAGSAVAIGCVLGVPFGALVAISRFRGRGAVIALLNAMMGLPPVVVGLAVYLLLSRSGPLGSSGFLFTASAMVVAQAVLVTPLIAALARQTIEEAETELGEQLRSLRLTRVQRVWALVVDMRFALLLVLLAAFGRAMSEVGAVLVVGGNIAGHTRTMTTAISLETQKGDLPMALALGFVLIGLVIAVNALAAGLRAFAMRVYG